MFDDEDWDADTSSTPVATNYRNSDENSFSPKSPVDTSKRTSIGRGRGKFSPHSGQFNQNQGQFNQNQGSGFSNNSQGDSYKPRSKSCYKCGEEGHISRDCPGGGSGSGANGFNSYKPRSNNSRDYSGGDRRGGGFKNDRNGGYERKSYNSNRRDDSGFGGGYEKKSYNSSRGDDSNFGGNSFGGGYEKKSYNSDRGDDSNFGGNSFGGGRGYEKKSYNSNRGDNSNFGGNSFGGGRGGYEKKSYNSSRGDDSNFGSNSFGGGGYEKKNYNSNRGDDNNDGFGRSSHGSGGYEKKSFNDSRGDNSNDDAGGFRGGRGGGGFKRRDSDKNDNAGGPPRENYVPPAPPEDENEMYNSLQRGINFNKYDSIPVEVSGENCPKPIQTFEQAHLTDTIAKNVARAKYEKPTPVQKYGIPIVNAGRDLMACAQTGSGKTAAFLLPALTAMIKNGIQSSTFSDKQTPQAIIVGPTRELVNQIYLECRKFARGSICRPCVAYGGTSVGHQLGDIQRGCNILIATPGRLMDFINKGRIGLDHVQFLILDEADRMLDMGFEGEIRKLAQSPGMPAKTERQTLMFSATFPDEIQKLAHEFLREDFIFLTVGRIGGACSDVTQNIIQIDQNDKREKLLELLADVGETRSRTLVFVETKRSADFLACSLSQSGYPTTSIHGDRLQREREEALRDFKMGKHPILIATSVAARGLDIPNVEHVINYDLPKDIDEYVHRIGRTGRCGNLGRATSFYDNSKDSETARCLIRILAESLQEVPAWLEGCAEGAIGTNFGSDRGNFGGRDARTKGRKDFSSGGGSRQTGDYDYNDGGGFQSKSSFGGNSGGGGGFGNSSGGGDFGNGNSGGGDDFGDESWD